MGVVDLPGGVFLFDSFVKLIADMNLSAVFGSALHRPVDRCAHKDEHVFWLLQGAREAALTTSPDHSSRKNFLQGIILLMGIFL
jgi:hypothetical protein